MKDRASEPSGSSAPANHKGESGETQAQLIPEYSGTETILLVDDDPMIRNLLTSALDRYGYRLLVACDGGEALELANAHRAPIHLLVSDVVMPNRDGVSLGRELRRWHPTIGLLLMSGHPDSEREARSIAGDSTFFIGKPFGIDRFVASVRAALDWRPMHTPSRESIG